MTQLWHRIINRWRIDRFGFALNMLQRRSAARLTSDFEAKTECLRMRRLVNAARISAAKGAVISTSRQAIGTGIDNDTACVILQWLELATRP